ncbi:MAG TPA: DciA family protein [Stellaceae bacterium]|nr:DciA family protein [Stellaceae bacterium]
MRLAGRPGEGERRPGLRAAGAAAARVAGPIVARGGGGVLGRLKAEWPAVIGGEWAASTWPDALGRDGALKLRVLPHAALEIQHRAPLVIERINLFFGRIAVSRLVLMQGPLPLAPARRVVPPARLTAADETVLDAQVADIADPELRAALSGLGQLVLAQPRRGR